MAKKKYNGRINYKSSDNSHITRVLSDDYTIDDNPIRRINDLIRNNKVLSKITGGSSASSLQLGIDRSFKDTSAKKGNPLMLDFIDIAMKTPKTSTSKNIMMTAVNGAVRYSYQRTPYRTNLHTLNKTISAAQAAINKGNFTGIVFDLETITGKNEAGKDTFSAITEISMRVLDHNFKEATSSFGGQDNVEKSIHAIIGLNEKQETDIRNMLSGYMSGKTKFKDLTEQQKVAVQEILNFNEATVKNVNFRGMNLVQTVSKKSREDIESMIDSHTGAELAEDIESGLRKLRQWHDNSSAESALSYLSDYMNSINGTDTFGIGANVLAYDNNVLRASGLVGNLPTNGFIDITEIWRQHTAITGKETRGGAQQSNIFAQMFPGENPNGVAHIASTDTEMSARIAETELGTSFSAGLKYREKQLKKHDFEIGGIYKAHDTISSPIGFSLGKEGTIIASTGYYKDPLNPERSGVRDYAYPIGLSKGFSYELVDHELVDLTNLSSEQTDQLKSIMGDKYIGDSQIHMIGMRPILDSNSPETIDGSTKYLFLNPRDFDATLGDFERVGTVTEKDGKRVIQGLYGNSEARIKDSMNTAIDYHTTEKAVRSFEDAPYKTLSDFNLYYQGHQGSIKELSAAIATGDISQINAARAKIATEMRTTYSAAGKSNAPELADKLSYASERLESLLPLYNEFNTIAASNGIDGSTDKDATFKKALDYFTDSLSYVSSDGIRTSVSSSRIKPLDSESLTLHLPGLARPGATSDAMTIGFGQNFDRYKLAEKLNRLSDKKKTGVAYADEVSDVNMLRKFVSSLTDIKSYDGVTEDDITAISSSLVKHGLMREGTFNKKGASKTVYSPSDLFNPQLSIDDMLDMIKDGYSQEELDYLKTQSRGDILSSVIYDALNDSGIRSKSTTQRMIPFISPDSSNGTFLKQGNRPIKTVEDMLEGFRNAYKVSGTVKTQSSNYFFSAKTNGKTEAVNAIYGALVDDPFKGTKFKDFLETRGFSAKEIADKATAIQTSATEYKSYIEDMVSSYLDEGFQFQITDHGVQVRDPMTDWQDLVLPKMRMSDNGTAYWQMGSKDMLINTHAVFDGYSGKIALHSDFQKDGFRRSSKRSIVREQARGNNVTAQTLIGQVGYDMRSIFSDTPDAFSKSESSKYVSGGVLDVVNLADHMFSLTDEDSLDSSGFLNKYRANHRGRYDKLKEAYIKGKKARGDQKIEKVADLGMEFYELFTAESDSLFDSIAEGTSDPDTKNLIKHISASATQEKLMDRGMYVVNAPRYDTPLSNFLNQKRNTGYQNAKAPIPLNLEKMKAIGAKEYRTIESESTLKAHEALANKGLVTSARIDVAHLSQEEYNKIISTAQLGDISKTYGDDTYAKALEILNTVNLENDGSFITSEFANALPVSDVNNKMIDVVNKGLYKIEAPTGNKTKKIDAIDMIPKITINSDGSIDVKYSKEFYVKQGSTMVMFDRDESISKGTLKIGTREKTKRNAIGSFRYYDDNNIEISEKDVAQAISEIGTDAFTGRTQDEQAELAARLLKEKKGITMKFKLEDIRLANKVGFGEEKSYATSLTMAIGASKEMRDILDKYRNTQTGNNDIIESIMGVTMRDDAFDVIAKQMGMADSDATAFKKMMHSPTDILHGILKGTSAENAHMFTNIGELKHESVESNVALMSERIMRDFKEKGASDEEITKFFSSVLDGKAIYDSKKGILQLTDEKVEQINSDILIKKYNEITKNERANDIITTTVSVNAAKDWSASKFSGHIAKELSENEQLYKSGVISRDTAIRRERDIRLKYSDEFFGGVKVSNQELEVIGRQRYNDATLNPFIGAKSQDAFISKTQEALERKGVLSKVNGKYELAESGRDQMIYSGAYSDYSKTMLNGYDYDMKSSRYTRASLDKAEAKDIVDDYTGKIRTFNQHNSVIQKQMIDDGDFNVVKASDIIPAISDAQEEAVKLPNNPYANDMVVDLGEGFGGDFSNDRYVAIKGIDPKFFKGNDEEMVAIKNNYQKSLDSLQRSATILDKLQNDTLSLEERSAYFGSSKLTKDQMIEKTKQDMVNYKNSIIKQQEEIIVTGKNSINSEFKNFRADISAMLETQTANWEKLDKNFTYDGTALTEQIRKGNLVDFAVINTKSAEDMGLFDQADKYVDMLKKDNNEYYQKLIGELGEGASNKDIMKLSSQREGITMFMQRFPTVHDQSVMSARIYTTENGVQDNTAFVAEWAQKKMKNDNDSDKVEFYTTSERIINDQKQDSEMNLGQRIQARRNVMPEHKSADKQTNPSEALSKRSAFGVAYDNIADADEFENVYSEYSNSASLTEFENLFKKARDESEKSGVALDKVFETKAATSGDFSEMKKLFVDRRRMDDALIAEVAQSSKAKVGYINNAVANFTSIGDQYSLLRAKEFDVGSEDFIRYHAANELINRERGDLIENVINAKNTVKSSDQVSTVSDMLNGMRDMLTGNSASVRNKGQENLHEVIDRAIGSKYDDYIDNAFKQNTYLAQYLNKALDLEHNKTVTQEDKRKAAIDLTLSVMRETSTTDNRAFQYNMKYATPIESSDGSLVRDIAYKISDSSASSNNAAIKENADYAYTAAKVMTETVSSGSAHAATGSAARAVSQTIKNSVSKNIALGAVGIAASIFAVGIIGGNPSRAPQDDAQTAVPKDAYRYDNYNYETGTVNPMMPPMDMPQGQNRGYVVNMRASTNGSYYNAEQKVAQATQQSYSSSNYSFTMNRKFSYSSQQDNDAYVEGILNRLI